MVLRYYCEYCDFKTASQKQAIKHMTETGHNLSRVLCDTRITGKEIA